MLNPATLAFVTDFCDQAVILPAFAVVAIALLVQRRRRIAGAWVLSIAGVLGVMLVLKLTDQACGWQVPLLTVDGLDLMSPSGHSASAAALWGCGAALLVAGRGRRTVVTALIVAAVMSVLIGYTRVRLGAHTTPEVVAGAIVGTIGAGVFGVLIRGSSDGIGARWPLVAAFVAMGVMHGQHLGAEPTIHSAAVHMLREAAPACQPPPDSAFDRWIERRQFNRS